MRRTRFAALAAAAAMVATPVVMALGQTAASASSLPCAPTATIVSRTGSGYVAWAGKETRGKLVKFRGRTLTNGIHFYELHAEAITLRFGRNTFALRGNAVFALSCSGEAVGQKAKMPSIRLLRGTTTVRTTHAVEGSVATEEGLYSPVPGSRATSFTVTRTLRQRTSLSMTQRVDWFLNYRNQPTGTSVSATRTRTLLNVTPYVGSRHGSCRHVHSAVLTTRKSFGHGTAVYHF